MLTGMGRRGECGVNQKLHLLIRNIAASKIEGLDFSKAFNFPYQPLPGDPKRVVFNSNGLQLLHN